MIVSALLPRALKRSYRERRTPLRNALNKGLVAPLWVVEERCSVSPDRIGLTHEITMVRRQGRQGVYVEDRSIRALGVDMPSEYLLPRSDEYTRVYTTVYPRVHNSIHACTLPRSKCILCRACL